MANLTDPAARNQLLDSLSPPNYHLDHTTAVQITTVTLCTRELGPSLHSPTSPRCRPSSACSPDQEALLALKVFADQNLDTVEEWWQDQHRSEGITCRLFKVKCRSGPDRWVACRLRCRHSAWAIVVNRT